jgi:hypothetical protein
VQNPADRLRRGFGESVGSNIISGVQAQIAATPGTTLRVVNTSSASALSAGVFAHASNGSNGNPGGKNDAFEATLRAGVGGAADIAFFTYCYVDVTSTSDASARFDDYRSHRAALKAAYPRVRFVHVTVPLTTSSPCSIWRRPAAAFASREGRASRAPGVVVCSEPPPPPPSPSRSRSITAVRVEPIVSAAAGVVRVADHARRHCVVPPHAPRAAGASGPTDTCRDGRLETARRAGPGAVLR